MARSELNTVSYFPLYCDEGQKMFYIEETYGNDGFSTFIKILRELAKTEYHYLDLSKPTSLMFLSAKCKVGKDLLNSIITDLVELGKFDKELWEKSKIIWCQDFVDSVKDAYDKRKNNCITRNSLLELLYAKGVLIRPKLSPKLPKGESQGDRNTQRKEEYIKEDKVDVDFDKLKTLWNTSFYKTKVPKVDTITERRKKAVNAVLKIYGKEKIRDAILKIKDSKFLLGEQGNDWKINFDWLFIVGNFTKVIEGNYDKTTPDTSKSIFG